MTTAFRPRRAGLLAAAFLSVLVLGCGRRGEGTAPAGRRVVAAAPRADSTDVRWDAVRHVFALPGKYEDGYFRVEFPRTDLKVRIGADALEPEFEFVSHFSFAPATGGGVMAMGEVVMRQDEAPAVLAEAQRQGVEVAAVHNHLLGEEPRIVYMHMVSEGRADSVAARFRAILARTAAPLRPDDTPEPPAADWRAVDAVLGGHEEAEGKVASYVFPRKEAHAVHGEAVQSAGVMETATEAAFQDLGGGRAASTGEMYVAPAEVADVLRALESHGLHLTALHNHMLDESPRMYFVHWYATGDAPTLARGVAAALRATNSEQRSSAGR
jgi:pyruvate-formate lyase-activating enzyme